MMEKFAHLAAKYWHLSAPNIAVHRDRRLVLVRFVLRSYDQLSTSGDQYVFRVELDAWSFFVKHESSPVDEEEEEDGGVRVKEDSLPLCDHNLERRT